MKLTISSFSFTRTKISRSQVLPQAVPGPTKTYCCDVASQFFLSFNSPTKELPPSSADRVLRVLLHPFVTLLLLALFASRQILLEFLQHASMSASCARYVKLSANRLQSSSSSLACQPRASRLAPNNSMTTSASVSKTPNTDSI